MEDLGYKTTKPLIPTEVELWYFEHGYKVEVEKITHTDSRISYEYERKTIKPAINEIPEKVIFPLKKLRKELLNLINGLNTDELFDLDRDWTALNRSLCESYGFLKIGSVMDLSEVEDFYERFKSMKSEAGLASLDIKKIWKRTRIEQIQSYYEDSDLWIRLLREIHYIDQISGRKDINEERLKGIMKIYSPIIQAMLNEDLREISPRIKWNDGSLYFKSSNLIGNILLYCLDNLHTRIQRCFGCGKFISAERSTKKFCVKSGTCQKSYSRLRKESKNKGLESFILNGIAFNTKSGMPI